MNPTAQSEVQPTGKWGRLAWLPILLLLAAIIAASVAGLSESYKAETLRLVLSFIFYTLVSLGTLFLIGRSFLASGSPGLLLLECGVVLWSLAGTVGDYVCRGDANINVTIFNIGILLAGLCHLAGAIIALSPQRVFRAKAVWLGAGIAAALGALWLISQAALSDWLPVFFIPGHGGTPVRHAVLISAIAMFVLSAGVLHANRRTARLPFTSWYKLALVSLAVGLFGIMIQLSLGSVVNWLSRTAQWLGGIYLLFAALASLRESDLPLFPVEKKSHPAYYRDAVAVAVVLTAAAIRLAFLSAMGTHSPYVVFFPAVMFAAIYGGLRPGLLATVMSTIMVDYFWIEPVNQFKVGQLSDQLSIIIYLLSGGMVSWVTDSMHRARARASEAEAKTLLAAEREKIQQAINRIFEKALTCDTEEELGRMCLSVVERLTDSKFSFVGEIGEDGCLHDIAISDPGWELCTMYDRTGHRRPPGNFKIHGLYGRVLLDGKSVLVNEPALHPDSIGTPEGHPKLTAFLGVPFIQRGKTIGMVAVGNRDGGYMQEQQWDLEAVVPAIFQTLLRKRAEEALERMKNILSEGQKIAHLGTFEYMADTQTTVWSEEEYHIYGLDPTGPSPAYDVMLAESIHPDDAALLHQTFTAAMQTGSIYELEHRVLRPDGSMRWVYERAHPYFDQKGNLVRYVGATLDITERRQAEEALRIAHGDLEKQVQERTSELADSVERLRLDNLQRKWLEENLRESEKRVRFFASQCLTAQETERRRIAGELHDSIAASLAAMKFRIENIAEEMKQGNGRPESLEDVALKMLEINNEVRRIMADLRPSILDDLGIIPAIDWFCREYQKTYSHISVEKRMGISEAEVPDSLKTPIFRISQEAMNNISKYSKASLVNLSLLKEDGKILLTIEDNGKGFDVNTVRRGLGLSTMEERAQLSGGSFDLESAIGKGTIIRASWTL